ncbi:immunity 22 family protein [Virgibacillus proomii]|jgi:hypothetical protein|uniref:immunity 22 family protein n=1 Tax=Virgibacillus proomii TaxID=84407 RepID=UPI000986DD1C|nr:immunity 22 family protein [Virgibacillus proomii]
MEKQGTISIWLGNVKKESFLEEYVNLTYDEEGESVPSKFFIDFNIEIDEDFIEKAMLDEHSNDISFLLKGCSYEEIIIRKIKHIKLTRSYNAVILIYNFEYNNEINSTGEFDFITSTRYLQ